MTSRFQARTSYFGLFETRISLEMLVFGRIFGRIDRLQIGFEHVWVTLISPLALSREEPLQRTGLLE